MKSAPAWRLCLGYRKQEETRGLSVILNLARAEVCPAKIVLPGIALPWRVANTECARAPGSSCDLTGLHRPEEAFTLPDYENWKEAACQHCSCSLHKLFEWLTCSLCGALRCSCSWTLDVPSDPSRPRMAMLTRSRPGLSNSITKALALQMRNVVVI